MMMQKPHSLVLTSGSLKPITSFGSELGVEFAHVFENKHIINSNQARLYAIGSSLNSHTLEFSYFGKKVMDQKTHIDLGHTVYLLANTAPGGVLVFFGSKSDMKTCYDVWLSDPILKNACWFVEGSKPVTQLQ